MKVIETINFLHELDLLEAHLDEHQHFMDEIIIIESEITYSGMKKPLFFEDNKERFRKFNVKHDIVPIDLFTLIPATYPESERKKWFDVRRNNREAQQKYMFSTYKDKADYLCNSDTDEIWSRDQWFRVEECMDKEFRYIAPSVKRFQNYVDAVGKGQEYWRITRSDMSTHVRQKGVIRGATDGHCGWHFTSCYKDMKDMWFKAVGLAQSVGYLGWGNVPSPEEFQEIVDNGVVPILNQKLEPRSVMPLDDISWLPPWMRDNKDKFPWLPEEYREGRTVSGWRLR